jgi:hypothetical protein
LLLVVGFGLSTIGIGRVKTKFLKSDRFGKEGESELGCGGGKKEGGGGADDWATTKNIQHWIIRHFLVGMCPDRVKVVVSVLTRHPGQKLDGRGGVLSKYFLLSPGPVQIIISHTT